MNNIMKPLEEMDNDNKKADMINHPSHYETGKYECIEVMQEAIGAEAVKAFCKCNAFKYLYRAERKNGIEDIKKAKWYLDKYIELQEPGEIKITIDSQPSIVSRHVEPPVIEVTYGNKKGGNNVFDQEDASKAGE